MKQQILSKEELSISKDEQRSRKKFLNFTEYDEKLLRELLPLVQANADRIVECFYENIRQFPELIALIDRVDSNIDRLKQAQRQYLLEIFEGDYSDAYFERRLRIGLIHNKIGLTPRWYIGSYNVYIQQLTPLIIKKYRFRVKKRRQSLNALIKIISLDSQLAMDTYIHGLMTDMKNISLSKAEIEKQVSAEWHLLKPKNQVKANITH